VPLEPATESSKHIRCENMRLERIQLCSAITKGLPGNTLLEISALCPAALLPELQPAPCFLSAIIGQID